MRTDFRRLAQVRARQSSRRKRRLRGLSVLGIAAVIVSVSQFVAPVLPGRLLASRLAPRALFLSPAAAPVSEPAAAPVSEEARGRVEIVEPGAGIIRVSSGFLGLASVELVVDPETLIVVGDKEGGFGDIRDGGRVKAAYDASRGTLRAKRVEIIVQTP
jgi:hypothetical protein